MKKLFIIFIFLFSLTFISACRYSTNTYDNDISVGYDQDFVEQHYIVDSDGCNEGCNRAMQNARMDTTYNSNQDYDYSYKTSYQSTNRYSEISSKKESAVQKNLPLNYYGSDRGFVSDSRYLNQGTPSNIDSEKYYYKYSPYFGGYYEAYKCYNNPPKNKLFYVKCP